MSPPAAVRSLSLGLLLGLLLGLGLLPEDALGQRPFRLSDPFYRGETARRHFFDNYALTGEVSYRSAGTFQGDGVPAANSDLAFRFRFDYELTRRFDLSAIFDAAGGAGTRRLALSWLVLKYYRYVEETHSDYAIRLAVDPSANGNLGFPQVDLAFLYTSLLSPVLSTDFALGIRRVNIGYAQLLPPEPISDGIFVIRPTPTLLFTRALGTEMHLLMNYNLHFDPAESNLFIDFLGEVGSYDVVEAPLEANAGLNLADLGSSGEGAIREEEEQETSYRGGTFWVRFGVEFNRPGYQISPFLGAPLRQWTPKNADDDWPEARLHFGFQLMLR